VRLLAWLEQRFNLTEMASFLSAFGVVPAELDTRRPLIDSLGDAMRRPLPSYARWPRVLGLLSFLLFLFLVVTGGLLAFYYQPTESEAYRAVTAIVRDVSFGWFVHQLHRWSARLLLVILLVRLWRFFFQGTYKAPREALWVVGLLTFLAATHADLTGRLLPFTTSGYWTTVRALEVLYALPALGPIFSFLLGGTSIDSLTLTRFYVLHVCILPAILLILFYLHFNGVRRVGLSALARESRATPKVQMYNLTILMVLIFGGLVTLVTLLPAPFQDVADPTVTPPGTRPPWYLLASHGLIELVPGGWPRFIGGVAVELILLGCLALPFLDRSVGGGWRDRRLAIAAGVVVLLLWAALSWHGYSLEAGRS
jgi:quinol-cytochrome oxidoreductase complex cytochrome b subunit